MCQGNFRGRDGTGYNTVDCFQLATQFYGDRPLLPMHLQKLPLWCTVLCALVAGVRAQETAKPLNRASPLMRPASVAVSSGQAAVALAAAQRAQALGLPAVAAGLYRQLSEAPATAGLDQAELTLALATALLDDARATEAEQVLNAWIGLRGAAWHLRAALAAAQLKKIEAAKLEVAAIKAEELRTADLAWFYFLQGALFDQAAVRDVSKANEFSNNCSKN